MSDALKIKRLLLVKMSALGDVVMSLPALIALKKSFPEMDIDWLVEPPAAGLISGHPLLNKLIISPRKNFERLLKSGRILAAKGLWSSFQQELKEVEYDAIVDLQGLMKSAALVWLAKGRRKIGFAKTREQSGWALTEKMPAYDPERHAALRYLDAAAYLGAEVSETPPPKYYIPSAAGVAEAEGLTGGKPYLVLNPGAKWAAKRWPASSWAKLAVALAAEKNFMLVVTGGRDDEETGQSIAKAAFGRVLNLCGRTTLPALAAVLEGARMTITADTGPMHLAAAVGSGGLALFGPTRPWRTGPFGGRFKIMTPPADCLGCLKKKCGKTCLELLSPENVLAAALDYLEGSSNNF